LTIQYYLPVPWGVAHIVPNLLAHLAFRPIFRDMETTTDTFQNGANDFRLYLQNELVRRCRSNPNYSLRAFAVCPGNKNHFKLEKTASPVIIEAEDLPQHCDRF
jgi:hypothetical protein